MDEINKIIIEIKSGNKEVDEEFISLFKNVYDNVSANYSYLYLDKNTLRKIFIEALKKSIEKYKNGMNFEHLLNATLRLLIGEEVQEEFKNENYNIVDKNVDKILLMNTNNYQKINEICRILNNIPGIILIEYLSNIFKNNKKLDNLFSSVFKNDEKILNEAVLNLKFPSDNAIDIITAYCDINNLEIIYKEENEYKVNNNDTYSEMLKEAKAKSKILSFEETKELKIKYENGDKEARDKLFECNLLLVAKVLRSYNSNVSKEDSFQDGCEGLLKAIDKYDYNLGYRFSTYAIWWIRQSITRNIIENNGSATRIPVHAAEKVIKINKIREQLALKLNRPPTNKELAKACNMSIQDLESLISATTVPVSMQEVINNGDGDSESTIGDFIMDERQNTQDEAERNISRNNVFSLILNSSMEDRKKAILILKYGLYKDIIYTLEQVGVIFNLTRERIRQLQSNAVRKLRIEQEFSKKVLEYNPIISFNSIFSSYDIEDVKKALNDNFEGSNNFYKLFGKDLNDAINANKLTEKEIYDFYISYVDLIIKLDKEKYPKITKPIERKPNDGPLSMHCYFKDEDFKKIFYIIEDMPNEYKYALKLVFGDDYESPTDIKLNNYQKKLFRAAISYIKRYLNKSKTYKVGFYDFFLGYTEEELRDALLVLSEDYRHKLQMVFGNDLKGLTISNGNDLSKNDIYKITNIIKKTINLRRNLASEYNENNYIDDSGKGKKQ